MLAHHLRVRRLVLRDVESLRAWLLSNAEGVAPADVLQAHGEIYGLLPAPSGGTLRLEARQLTARWTLAQLQVVTTSGEDWTLRAIARCEREPGLGAQVLDLVDCACDVLEVLVGVSEAELFASLREEGATAPAREAVSPSAMPPASRGPSAEPGPRVPDARAGASGRRPAASAAGIDVKPSGAAAGSNLWLEAAMVSQAHAVDPAPERPASQAPPPRTLDRAPSAATLGAPPLGVAGPGGRAVPAAGVPSVAASTASSDAPRPAAGDYVHHRKFGICRVDQVREGDTVVLRTHEGPRKTVKLSLFRIESPIPYQGRRLYKLAKAGEA